MTFILSDDPIKVLIADDSSTVRNFVQSALLESGTHFEFTLAENGREAVERLETEAFDIAFLDINMPHISGVEVMEALHLKKTDTFAISMSDSLTDHSASRLKAFGAYDFLTKPFTKLDVGLILNTFATIKTPFDILVVDDSATVRTIVRKVLARSLFNLRVEEAHDGPSALDTIRSKSFRMVFADFNMPGMTGMELAERLAEEARQSDVILMSTEYSDALDQAAQKVGARAFLRKPFYPEDVDSVLHHVLGLRHPHFSKHVRFFRTTNDSFPQTSAA